MIHDHQTVYLCRKCGRFWMKPAGHPLVCKYCFSKQRSLAKPICTSQILEHLINKDVDVEAFIDALHMEIDQNDKLTGTHNKLTGTNDHN